MPHPSELFVIARPVRPLMERVKALLLPPLGTADSDNRMGACANAVCPYLRSSGAINLVWYPGAVS